MGKKDELARGFLIGGIAVGLGYIGINTIFVGYHHSELDIMTAKVW